MLSRSSFGINGERLKVVVVYAPPNVVVYNACNIYIMFSYAG
jgi:hypothetical protein